MVVVSNTSPISALASIGRLSLLQSQFSKIRIPTAVSDELKLHPDPAALKSIEIGLQHRWIEVVSTSSSHFLRVLRLSLHPGEAQVIALATEIKADLVIIDEQEGTQMAAQAGLNVVGILGILLRAKLTREISAIKPEILALRTKARFFIAASLEARILSAAGE